MILAKARLIAGGSGKVKVALSFPPGFDPEDVVGESIRANGEVSPVAVRVDPRKGIVQDIYREFEVSFPEQVLGSEEEVNGTLRITGQFRRGLPFTASVLVGPKPRGRDQ